MKTSAQLKFRRGGAFTLIELLVVVAIILILAGLLLSSLTSASEKADRTVCPNNLKQQALAMHLYGFDNDDELPRFPGDSGYFWDVPVGTINAVINSGSTRGVFYCPAFPEMNNDCCWSPHGNSGGDAHYYLGYTWVIKRGDNVKSPSISPPKGYVDKTNVEDPCDTELIFDVVLSFTSKGADKFYKIPADCTGNLPQGVRTSHLAGTVPSGGNIGFVDGHAEWRKFALGGTPIMQKRSFIANAGTIADATDPSIMAGVDWWW